jgi:hypothetical protein
MFGLHVCEMSFAAAGVVDDLLPFPWEVTLPIAMPRSLGLPPVIDAIT